MCHHDWTDLKQVEFNTMSAAASGVNRAANKWHKSVSFLLYIIVFLLLLHKWSIACPLSTTDI